MSGIHVSDYTLVAPAAAERTNSDTDCVLGGLLLVVV